MVSFSLGAGPGLQPSHLITAEVLPRADRSCQRWAVSIIPKQKPKIPRITFRAVQPLNLSDENWQAIEASYGHSISQEIRTQIKAVTTQFLQFATAEDTGLMNDAVKRIRRLRARAQSFNAAILERSIEDAAREDITAKKMSKERIREYVDDELALTYALLNYDQPLPGRNYVSRISLELGRFVNACNEVLDFAPQYDYWPDGGAWEVWIRQLTGILKIHHLPTGARKDSAKIKDDKFSAFVTFVQTLQTFLPRKHIRAQHSRVALATAINKARKESKPLVAPRKLRARKSGRNTNNSRP